MTTADTPEEQIMYKAELRDGFLVIREIIPYVYNRWGFGGLGKTESEAVDKLRARVVDMYEDELKKIDFQRGMLGI